MATCQICSKASHGTNNVPNSMHKTRRMVRANVQTVDGIKICTRCMRTLKNKGEVTVK